MTHAKNKVEWCLKKAGKELEESKKHRGLVKVKPNIEEAGKHIKKAEHFFKATSYLKKGNFSDISTSTVFYSMYHCLLAIAIKFGYESGNQECTFALIQNLIDDRKIKFEKEVLDKIANLNVEKSEEKTTIEFREKYQYGTSLSIEEDNLYDELIDLAKEIISKTKEIIEE